MNNREAIPLEALVERKGLYGALNLLSTIASEKADHIRADWRDEHTARKWERAAHKLDALADTFLKANL